MRFSVFACFAARVDCFHILSQTKFKTALELLEYVFIRLQIALVCLLPCLPTTSNRRLGVTESKIAAAGNLPLSNFYLVDPPSGHPPTVDHC